MKSRLLKKIFIISILLTSFSNTTFANYEKIVKDLKLHLFLKSQTKTKYCPIKVTLDRMRFVDLSEKIFLLQSTSKLVHAGYNNTGWIGENEDSHFLTMTVTYDSHPGKIFIVRKYS